MEIKKEMERFEMHRIKDFKANLVRYLEDQMAHQQQVILRYLVITNSIHIDILHFI